MHTAEKSLFKEYVAVEEHFSEGQSYTFPISFKNDSFETFKGKKVDFQVRIQPLIERPGEKVGFFKKLFGGSPRKYSSYLTFKQENPAYHATEGPLDLSQASQNTLGSLFSFFVLSIIIGVAAYNIFSIPVLDILIVGFGLVVLLILFMILKRSVVGQMEANLLKADVKSFQLVLSDKKLWSSIRSLKVWYEVTEKVVDNRGTSTQTYHKNLYTSEKREVSHLTGTPQVSFSFPLHAPATQSFGDASIYWQLKIRAHSNLGIPFTLSAPFEVTKSSIH